jgi:hypothetical protein
VKTVVSIGKKRPKIAINSHNIWDGWVGFKSRGMWDLIGSPFWTIFELGQRFRTRPYPAFSREAQD